MNDSEEIKTFTPVLPSGKGPTGNEPHDAVLEILLDLNDRHCLEEPYSDSNLQAMAYFLSEVLGLLNKIDGEYVIFEDYKVHVETMSQERFDALKEFQGY